jgi:hypothetical protein
MLLGIVLLSILPRLAYVDRDHYLDFHAWRQSDSAAFTNGYLNGSWNPFEPAIDRQPCKLKRAPFGRVEAELPIMGYLAAIPLRLLGRDHASPSYLRALSIAVFAAGCLLLFACVRELGGSAASALLAVAAFAAAPMGIFFTRSPQPDGHSLSFAIGSVLVLERYLNRGRNRDALLTCLFVAVLLLSKVSNAYLGILLAYMALSRLGMRGLLRDWRLWLAGALACAVTAAWYWHAHSFAWTFGIWRADEPLDKKFADVQAFADPESWKRLGARVGWDILTPAGCVLAAIGLGRPRARWVRVGAVWLASALIFVLVTLHAQLRHSYYQLVVIPPAAILAAAGVRALWQRASGRLLVGALAALHGATAFAVLWGSWPTSTEGQSYFSENIDVLDAVEAVRALVPEKQLLITSERDPRLYGTNSGHRGYFGNFGRMEDALRCMSGVSDHLLLGAHARNRLARSARFRAAFDERWHGRLYSLYELRPLPAAASK